MSENQSQFDYPVEVDRSHTASESVGYSGDKFTCKNTAAYTHTGAWPTWEYCPYCGLQLGVGENDD